jgi:hypothetical protein
MRLVALRWLPVALALVAGAAAWGDEWGAIAPGASTMDAVRERYGAPTREARQKVEGYDTVQWVYEGGQAPPGVKRLTVEFGMLMPQGYLPNLVRFFILEPNKMIFSRNVVLLGWGTPDIVGEKEGRKFLFYRSGLLVYLDAAAEDTVSMLFSIPQPEPEPVDK